MDYLKEFYNEYYIGAPSFEKLSDNDKNRIKNTVAYHNWLLNKELKILNQILIHKYLKIISTLSSRLK